MRNLKETLMECRDNLDKYKQDMYKLEDRWNQSLEMLNGNMILRLREMSAKIKAQCTFADKEHKQLHSAGDNLSEEITELSNNVGQTENKMIEIEEFVGLSHDLVSKGIPQGLDTVQE